MLPNDVNAEASLLSIIINNFNEEHTYYIFENVKVEHFYKVEHQVIYSSILNIFTDNKNIDVVVLLNQLTKEQNVANAGGKEYIVELLDFMSSSPNYKEYIDIVKEKYSLRRLQVALTNGLDDCKKGVTPDKVIDSVSSVIFSETENKSAIRDIKDVSADVFKAIEERTCGVEFAIRTGFYGLDHYLGGFNKGNLIILGARPAMGKTALALNLTENVARGGGKVLFFSMEMTANELVSRMISSQSRINSIKISRGREFSADEIQRMTHAVDTVSKKQIFIDDSGFNTYHDILLKIKSCIRKVCGLDLIVIDYLQLIIPDKMSKGNDVQDVSRITRALKLMAKEFGVPILCLSQLNRELERRVNKRPILADLRQSGSIEQDADSVLFLYREAVYDEDLGDDPSTELIVAKNRHGEIGTVHLEFNKEIVLFEEREIVFS